jgi:hypothetical protein
MFSTQQSGEATWDALKTQVARLGQLDGYPQPEYKPEAFRELVVALQNADSPEDAKRFIDDVMMCELICPKPSQLRDMIRSARESKQSSAPSYVENPNDPFETLVAQSKDPNLDAHLQFLLARLKEIKGMTWPQRQRATPAKLALEIASRQLLRGETVTGSY